MNKYLHLMKLLGNETRSPAAIRRIQDHKLRKLIAHAAVNTRFYRRHFEKAGINPADIRSVDDLARIPIIDKRSFHENGLEAFLDQRIRDRGRLFSISTSGSSGRPLTFQVDARYEALRKAQYLRPYLTNGRRPIDCAAIFGQRETISLKWFSRIGFMHDYAIYAGAAPEEQLRILERVKPAVVIGYGSALALLASHILENGGSSVRPRLVFTDSELLTPSARQKIKSGFRADVIDIYGTLETENIAYECRCHEGYHIAADCVIMEFVRDGRRVAPGEEGEIVCTVLDNFATPFIRYNVHDIGSFSDRPCSCGRTFPLMKVIGGRLDDYAVLANGARRSVLSLSREFDKLDSLIREYQIIQYRHDAFKVQVVRNPDSWVDLHGLIPGIILQEFPEAGVEVEIVSRIAREPSGKFRFFRSLVSGNGTAS